MSIQRKKGYVTLYLDSDRWERFKARVGNVSKKIDELVARYLESEADGETQTPTTVDYEALRRIHLKLTDEVAKLRRRLASMGAYEGLKRKAVELGLDPDNLDTLAEVLPKVSAGLLDQWPNRSEAHLFVTLLELAQQVVEVEAQMEKVRRPSS